MKVRCPKCEKEQEILEILHNRRVVCKHCGNEFKGVGLETTQIAEEVFSKFIEQRAERERAEEEDKKDTD